MSYADAVSVLCLVLAAGSLVGMWSNRLLRQLIAEQDAEIRRLLARPNLSMRDLWGWSDDDYAEDD